MAGCSSTRHVPDGSLLLDKVSIKVDRPDATPDSLHAEDVDVSPAALLPYLRQLPNHKVLGFMKLQLATYNMSGRDSTRSVNRWLRRLGQAPVLYDSTLTDLSSRQLRQALINRGFTDATVTVDTLARPERKKMEVIYRVHPGQPHVISSLKLDIPDPAIREAILADRSLLTLHPGSIFDRNALEAERVAITSRLRDRGYYGFVKDYITYIADTTAGSRALDLTLVIHPPRTRQSAASGSEKSSGAGNTPDLTILNPHGVPLSSSAPLHLLYKLRSVFIVTDADAFDVTSFSATAPQDTLSYHGIDILYGPDRYLAPDILYDKCYLTPGSLFSVSEVERTYEAMAQLGIIRYVNVAMREIPGLTSDGKARLDAYIILSRTRKQGITVELEGTNSEGDLGFGVGLTYQHRNLAHRSELLTAKLRASYESLSGNFEGLINNSYTEMATEVGITFPKFMSPFLSRRFKQRMKAATEFAVSFNYQERPEYTRIIAGAAWKYKWQQRQNTIRREFDLIDLSLVSLPRSTIDFLNTVAPQNPLLRYSYEDHLIMRMAYTYYRTNRRLPAATSSPLAVKSRQTDIYTLRTSVETAGNLLYLIAEASGMKRHEGAFKTFGIQFAQYVKGEVDYSRTYTLSSRTSLAWHVGAGLGIPYGNSSMIPFEKRFYAGGANGVRGWNVRTLGPGSYATRNSVMNFINQCGDIRFDASVEFRSKLFWVLEGALFVDAGNIWTIRNYENQPGGLFKFNTFYKQIAGAYGIGLRMDFTYFLLRFDLGMKAHNPAVNQRPWPIIHPRFSRDAAFHFSVGYPF
ncbi:MAG: BamA/TamA family outer membrane protein [Muribaculaceae bacterium]|nr:BamA/TamA family outer membrane protein [Muribaculaceae bacterium]